MLRLSKTVERVMLAAVLALGVQRAAAFSMWGPVETWQTPALDYLNRNYFYGEFELGGTKNFGEGSRLNVPVITYAYDATFLDYFGANGVKAIDSAFAVFNRLPNVSSASANLHEFITQGNQQINYTAQALNMVDLKSVMMGLIIEHMGLIGETHVFDLHERTAIAGAPACSFYYAVILRNFDPVTYDPTTYVNGQNYIYQINDACPVGTQVGDAFEYPADATRNFPFNFTAVATKEALDYGGFYLGLTRDDFGGLRYLYRKNNFNVESLDPEAFALPGSGSPFSPAPITQTNTAGAGGVTNSITQGVFGGIEKVLYVKVGFDSLVGNTFTPRQYSYNLPYVTNGHLQNITITRVITAPDILITAADLVQTPPIPFSDPEYGRTNTFLPPAVVSPGGGQEPNVISPTMIVTFNKVGTIYYNIGPAFVDLGTRIPLFSWGSFDGTTNAPIAFPTGTSLSLLEQQVLSGGTSAPTGAFNPAVVSTNGVTNAPVTLTY
jgi:hypothetical protein